MLAHNSGNTFTTASRTGGVRPGGIAHPINRVNLQSADPRSHPSRRRNQTTMYGAATRANGAAASGALTTNYADSRPQAQHAKTYSMHEPENVQRAMNIVSTSDMDNITHDDGVVKDIDAMMDADMDDMTGVTTTMDITTEAAKRSEQRRML